MPRQSSNTPEYPNNDKFMWSADSPYTILTVGWDLKFTDEDGVEVIAQSADELFAHIEEHHPDEDPQEIFETIVKSDVAQFMPEKMHAELTDLGLLPIT